MRLRHSSAAVQVIQTGRRPRISGMSGAYQRPVVAQAQYCSRIGRIAIVMAALTSLLLGACSPLRLLDAFGPSDGFTLLADQAYGPHARQSLDLFTPATPTRDDLVVLFVYGGSWTSGNRRDYRFVGQTLATRGLITVVADYRLFPEIGFPTFVEDVAAASAWIHRNLPAPDGQPRRLVLMGHSAGAHSAALVALDRSYLQAIALKPDAIAALIGLAGPYAFDPTTYASTREIFAAAPTAAAARPVTFAGSGAPSSFLLHGAADSTVLPANSKALAEALRSAGADARYREIDGVGHIGILLSLSPLLRRDTDVLDGIVAFVRQLPER